MEPAPASRQPALPPALGPAVICGLAGAALFQWFGNANRGYIDTTSLFYWWGYQWVNPASEGEHGWLILGLSAWLFWRNLRILDFRFPISDFQTAQSPFANWQSEGAAVTAMVAGLALHALGFVAQQARISILALLVFTWGVIALAGLSAGLSAEASAKVEGPAKAGGRHWGAAAVFPLGFMVFAIPINVFDSLGFWLRVWVVDASGMIARAAGIGVLQSGTQLLAPDGSYNYDVAAACSGLRSLTAMAALSLLAGYLNFRTWWRRALLLGLCFPLVYLGNVTRIVAIVFAAAAGGPRWGDLAHEVMGYGVFVIVLGGVLGAASALRRWAPESAPNAEGAALHAEGRGRGTSGEGFPGVGAAVPSRPEFPAPKGGRIAVEAVNPGRLARKFHILLSSEATLCARICHACARLWSFRANHKTARRFCPSPHELEAGARTPPRRQSDSREKQSECEKCGLGSAGPTFIVGLVVAAVVVALVGAEMVFLRHVVRSPVRGAVGVALAADGKNPVELPAYLGIEWTGRPQPVTAVERDILPPDTGFSRKLYFNHRNPAKQVFLSIVLSGRDRTSIHRPEVCLVGQGWTIAETTVHRFTHPGGAAGALPATVLRLRREVQTPRGKAVVPQLVAYWFVGGDEVVATHGRRLWRDGWNRVVHGRADRWAYVLLQTDAADGEAAALARMQAVLDATLPVFAPQVFASQKP